MEVEVELVMDQESSVETPWAWRLEVTPRNPHPRAELVVGKSEANPMGRMQLAAGAEPRSKTTPVAPMGPENWMKFSAE